jgi:hypothetical protein
MVTWPQDPPNWTPRYKLLKYEIGTTLKNVTSMVYHPWYQNSCIQGASVVRYTDIDVTQLVIADKARIRSHSSARAPVPSGARSWCFFLFFTFYVVILIISVVTSPSTVNMGTYPVAYTSRRLRPRPFYDNFPITRSRTFWCFSTSTFDTYGINGYINIVIKHRYGRNWPLVCIREITTTGQLPTPKPWK